MGIKQAIELIKRFNQWRRGETDQSLTMDDLELRPAEIGQALDALVNFAEVTVAAQGLFVDKQPLTSDCDSHVCCHTCNNQGNAKQNSLTIKCGKCGSVECNHAIWHKERCSDD